MFKIPVFWAMCVFSLWQTVSASCLSVLRIF